jgi:hypothetical protein
MAMTRLAISKRYIIAYEGAVITYAHFLPVFRFDIF